MSSAITERQWSEKKQGRNGRGSSAFTEMSHDLHRTLPHSIEAEQGVLGSMLISPREIIAECVEKINETYFYVPAHQAIYTVLTELHDKGQGIDMITFTQVLSDRGLLESVGGTINGETGPGIFYITALFRFVPTSANVSSYLEIVRDKYLLRQIIAACTESVRRSFEDQGEVSALLDEVQEKITVLGQGDAWKESLLPVKGGVLEVIERFETAYAHRGQDVMNGIATGFHDLDRMLTGLKPQQVITVAGQTSHGKTVLVSNIALHVAIQQKLPVGIWSMEMSFDELCQRLVCDTVNISLQRLRDGFLKRTDFEDIPKRATPLLDAPLYIDDTRGLSITDFKARVRRAVLRHDLKLVIADLLQLMTSSTKRAQENRAREIDEIMAGMKALAKELRIPVIVVSHLSREADKRASVFRRPKLSDLKESSSIEQHSDVVLMVWRPDRLVESDEDRQKLATRLKLDELNEATRKRCRQMEEIDGEFISCLDLTVEDYVEVLVPKQRNGPVTSELNRIVLRFVSDLTRFENLTPKMWSNNPVERQGAAAGNDE